MTRGSLSWLWVSTGLVSLSGVVFFVMKYLMDRPDAFSVINHPLQPWMLRLHVLSAPIFVFAFGMIVATHVVVHHRSKKTHGRKTGWTNVVLASAAIVSGYLLPVFTHEVWISVTAWTHIVLSTLFVLILVLHARRYLKDRKSR